MWYALAGCYESLDRVHEAIKCYERAEVNNDKEAIALSKLAKLYQKLGDQDKAAYYYKKNLDLRDQEGVEGQDTIDALLFLGTFCKNQMNLEEAEKYCSRLLDYAGRVSLPNTFLFSLSLFSCFPSRNLLLISGSLLLLLL
jgi:anaphase-promoting complex subunit 8